MTRGLFRGEDGQDPLLQKKGGFKVAVGGQAEEAQVDPPLAEPALDVLIAALEQFKGDVRVALGEGLQQVGQQVDGHAEEGADAHPAHLQAVEPGRLAEDLLVLLADGTDGGEKGLPFGGEADPKPVPGEQLQPQLVLQPGDDVADGRLGVAQNLRGLGEAAQVRRLQQDLILLNAHTQSPPWEMRVFPQYTTDPSPCPVGNMKGFESGFQKWSFYKAGGQRLY